MPNGIQHFDPALLPTDAEVKAYQQDGYYISRRIYTDQEIDAMIAAQDAHYRGERDTDFEKKFDNGGKWGWEPGDGNVLRKNDYTALMNHSIRGFVTKPLLGAIAARLSGATEIRLWHDQLLYKPGVDPAKAAAASASNNVGWHTDLGYWMSCSSEQMLTAWVPFQASNDANGSITMIKGSHRWPLSEGLNFFDGDLAGMEKNFNTGGNPVVKVPMDIPKGSASFHHCKLIHGSGPNKTAAPRRSIAIHMQPGDNHFREWRDKNGQLASHANDRLLRKTAQGKPDYSDPAICPTLYP